ncbi:hypothetical protein ADICEAN_01851 [Cesiribacter andamanensis AMV16]|uniref:Uncharacterized protein n=1 Tax=Cesiribacter andamanensis AMV16 TaxID=1279009 RepID=M7N6U4_9BACT|nr:hypothetical protein ADICEAN_01851 [Cesiribacter andamanensis AMV16]
MRVPLSTGGISVGGASISSYKQYFQSIPNYYTNSGSTRLAGQ